MPPGDYLAFIEGGADAGWPPLPFRVEAGSFVSEDIRLDAGNTVLRKAPNPRKDAEWIAIKAIYDRFDPEAIFMSGKFMLPVGLAKRSAFFGDRRRYLYFDGTTDASVHSGIDFAVQTGTPVLAPAGGRIVYEGKRIVTGLTLVLEHLPGMYSVFMHLSAFVAKPGSLVARGSTLARSGNTGLSTGPHLHWEIRVGGEPVNPDFFVAHSVSEPEGR
jgi:murein DD-endopeptidase MepM/ murein hydrolase activator NlpD